MARYDYRCTACGEVFEVEHPMGARPDVTCPTCGASAERVFAPSGIAFHGSGFYNTDQRGGGATEATSGSGSKCASCAGGNCANCA